MRIVTTPPVLPAHATMCAAEYVGADVEELGLRLPAELARAVPKRRHEFLAGRWCALEAIRRHAPSCVVGEIPIGPDRAPIWPPGLCGSITHTAGWAAAAIAFSRDIAAIGVDSEAIMSPATAANVRTQIATEDELRLAETVAAGTAALTLLFSAKEAVYKCVFPRIGKFMEHHDVVIVSVDPGTRQFVAKLAITLDAALPTGFELTGRFAIDDERVHTGVALSPDLESITASLAER